MSDPVTKPGPDTTAPAGGAAGAVLLRERRRQGLSLGDISRQLKLSVRQVEALERDDYSAYKGPVFIHGFIRNYAKLLGLEAEPLIRATDAMLNPPVIEAPVPIETKLLPPRGIEGRKNPVWPAVAAVTLVVIVLALYFGVRRAPDTAHSPPLIASGEGPALVTMAPKAAPGARTGAGTRSKSESRPGTDAATKPATRADTKAPAKPANVERQPPPEQATAAAAESSGRLTVRMIFDQDSWVEIKDSTGNTIFGQLNPAGSRRSVSGQPPLSVVIGNAAGVRLFRGDQSVDLTPHTRVDVARLTLE